MDEKFEDIKNKGLEKGKEGFEKVSNLAEPLAKKLGIKPGLFVGIAGGVVALVILICIITSAVTAKPSKEEKATTAFYELLGMSTSEAKKVAKKEIKEKMAAAKNLIIDENMKYNDGSDIFPYAEYAFSGCTSLPLKTQAKLQKLGYYGAFQKENF